MYFKGENFAIYHGDNRQILPTLAENSVDAIVTDPPYELGFMGKSWDASGVAFDPATWREALRVLKPGGHLIAFSGSRTYHRMAVAIEDAGFEIRDQIMWIYGSGFPKSHNVSKGIDKVAAVEREITREEKEPAKVGHPISFDMRSSKDRERRDNPATDEAKQWDGWGTALKPAHEPMVLARKPLTGTVAANVLTYGTGGLNIDGSRVVSGDSFEGIKGFASMKLNARRNGETEEEWKIRCESGPEQQESLRKLQELGRWPANVIHDGSDEVVALFPDTKSGSGVKNTRQSNGNLFSAHTRTDEFFAGDSGSAARFFYCAKASKRDRNEGLDGFEDKARPTMGNGIGGQPNQQIENNKNHHPTVKPTDLMRYLCRLITPPNGTVLDPFMGSGSTGKAAMYEEFKFIGIEMTDEYLPIAKARIEFAASDNEGFLL